MFFSFFLLSLKIFSISGSFGILLQDIERIFLSILYLEDISLLIGQNSYTEPAIGQPDSGVIGQPEYPAVIGGSEAMSCVIGQLSAQLEIPETTLRSTLLPPHQVQAQFKIAYCMSKKP